MESLNDNSVELAQSFTHQSYGPERVKVALFVGNDITSTLITNNLVSTFNDDNIDVVIFKVKHPRSQKPEVENLKLKEVMFWERHINDNVIPKAMADIDIIPGANYPYNKIDLAYDRSVQVVDVSDVNAPEFVEQFSKEKFVASVNIRGYQKYQKPIIEAANDSGGVFWNIHPGRLLPNTGGYEYRGIYTPIRVMLDGRTTNYWTFHEIDENWDTGPVLAASHIPILYDRPMIGIYLAAVSSVASMITNNVHAHIQGSTPVAQHTSLERGPLYSYPSQSELDEFAEHGYSLINPQEMANYYVSKFVNGGEIGLKHRPMIYSAIFNSAAGWYARNKLSNPLMAPSHKYPAEELNMGEA